MIVVGERDGRVYDRGAQLPRPLHGLDRVGEHVGGVHHGLHGPVQRAALGSEIVLIFDENDRRRFRIHLSLSLL